MKHPPVTITDLTRLETTEALERAVDSSFQRLIENARSEWQHRFGDKDPSDATVKVQITAPEAALEKRPTPGSGFVKSSKASFEQRSNISLPRYAQ